MRFYIEEAKCDASEFAKEFGLIPGTVVASVKYSTEEETKWLHCMDFQSLFMFFSTEEDLYDMLLNDDITNEEIAYAEQFQMEKFHGVDIPDYVRPSDLDLDCFYEEDADDSNKSVNGLLCYIMAVTLCPYDVTKECLALGVGKYSDKLDVEKLLSFVEDEW